MAATTDNPPKTVLITGATGFIGERVVEHLAARGDRVFVLSRDAEGAQRRLPRASRAFEWAGGDAPVPAEALAEVDAVVHLAGEPVNGRWTDAKKQAIRDSRVRGTRRIVEAIRDADQPPGVLVCASAIGYYGERGDEDLTEDSPPGDGFLSDVCLQWENAAIGAAEFGVDVTRVRIGLVMGRGGGALEAMLTPFKLGVGGPMGGGRQWWSWVHVADVVGLLVAAVDGRIRGAVNATAPEPLRQKAFAKLLGKVLHRPAFMPAPALALRAILGEFAEEVLRSARVLPAAALAAGYEFEFTDAEAALRDILDDDGGDG